MSITPRMLWFSVSTTDSFLVEYELPDNEMWFTSAQWRQYAELNDLAAQNDTTVHCSDHPQAVTEPKRS